MFYNRLYLLDPSLKPMFRRDMTEQGRWLIRTMMLKEDTERGLARIYRLAQCPRANDRI